MSTGEPVAPSDPAPDAGRLLELIERLDAENERLRLRVLEVMEWMEEAVTDGVGTERELDGCRERADAVAGELDAIHQTRSWRVIAPVRGLYGRLLQRVRGDWR